MPCVTVTGLGQKGDGLARLEDGRSVFVDRALPEETLDIQLFETKDGTLRGDIAQVIEPSADRADPPCPHYDGCGGCQMQHMQGGAYRRWKRQKLEVALAAHLPALPDFLPDIFIPAGTRRRVTFACIKTHKTLVVGYHKRRSKQVSDIEDCLIVDPDLMAVRAHIKPYLLDIIKDSRVVDVFLQKLDGGIDCVITGPVGQAKDGAPDFTVQEACGRMLHETPVSRISWRMRDRDVPELLLEAHPLFKKAGALQIPAPPLAFLQPSAEGEAALARCVVEALPAGAKTAADLFAGHGTFTGHMLGQGLHVDAFESDRGAVTALKKAGHARAQVRDLFKYPLQGKELAGYDVIVLDPPRAGAKAQSDALALSDVAVIIYVSCNPSTFARDAARLVDGGYTVQSIQMVDQFPWSTHTELVGVFAKM